MPPKVKITKQDILDTALNLLRESGESAVNARSIAAALNCSTQPVFSNFATMEALQEELVVAAYDHYLAFLKQEVERGIYPRYKAFGMAYIRFAGEEKELFKLLFMRNRSGEAMRPTLDFEASVEMIMQANGAAREKAELMHVEMWAFVHGIATMLTTSFVSFDWDMISNMMTDIYQGLCARHFSEEKQ